MITAQVTDQLIDLEALHRLVKSDQAGAVVIFSGDVRNHDGGKEVTSLTYEIHPSAGEVIKEITARITAKHEILDVAVVHRYGEIPIGESAFTVVVSSKHRGPAFAACQELVDVVKEELPIWKYQVFADGTDEWVNSA
jgi:molybdopterin synthase catalytic subunit